MKSSEYIDKVLSHISSKEYSKSVQSELQAHIDDEMEHYIRIGYSREEASEIVAEKMGDSALAGKQLDMLSSEKISKVCSIIILLLYAAEILFFWISVLAWESGYSFFGIISETSIVLLSLITLLVSNQYKNTALPFVSMAFTAGFYFIFVLTNSSVLLYSAFLLCTGRMQDIQFLLGVDNQITGTVFYILSNVPYFALLCAHIYIVKNSHDFNKQKYPLKKVYREIRVKRLLLIAFALIILLDAGTYAVYYLDVKQNVHLSFDGVGVVECDKQYSLEDIDDFDEFNGNYIEIDYDWGKNYVLLRESPAIIEDTADMLCDTVRYNSTISYDTDTIYGEFKASKKYVAVIPVVYDFDNEKYVFLTDEAEWHLADEIDQITGEFAREMLYKIKIV